MVESANTPPGGIKRNYSLRLGLNGYKPSITWLGMPQSGSRRKRHGDAYGDPIDHEQQGSPHSLSPRGSCRIMGIRAHQPDYPKV